MNQPDFHMTIRWEVFRYVSPVQLVAHWPAKAWSLCDALREIV